MTKLARSKRLTVRLQGGEEVTYVSTTSRSERTRHGVRVGSTRIGLGIAID